MKRWFRRARWVMMQKDAMPPRWHIVDIERTAGASVVALCGYSRSIILEGVSWKEDVRTKKLQCSKCVKKAEKGK